MTAQVEYKLVHVTLKEEGPTPAATVLFHAERVELQNTSAWQFAVDKALEYALICDPNSSTFPHPVKGLIMFCNRERIRTESMIDTVAKDKDMVIITLIDKPDNTPITRSIDWSIACAIQALW